MKHLSKFLPVKTLDQIYKAFVRPHLDYCDIIYHKQPQVSQSPIGMSLTSLMSMAEKVLY